MSGQWAHIKDLLDLKECGQYTCHAKMPIIKIKIPLKAADATPSISCSCAPLTQSIDLTSLEPECNEAPVPSPSDSSSIGVSQNDKADAITDLGKLHKSLLDSKGSFADIIMWRGP